MRAIGRLVVSIWGHLTQGLSLGSDTAKSLKRIALTVLFIIGFAFVIAYQVMFANAVFDILEHVYKKR
jgi:hypothetical protein